MKRSEEEEGDAARSGGIKGEEGESVYDDGRMGKRSDETQKFG